jgi:Fe-S-cluster containining protein
MKVANGTVTIGRNDLCPCGSGKRFKNCCKDKGHTYALFEGGDKRFAYDLTETNRYIDSILNTYNRIVSLRDDQTKIDKGKGLEILATIHQLADKALEPFLRHSSCKKGCQACCYNIIPIHAIEAEMICRFVKENFKPKRMSDVLAKIDESAPYYPDPFVIGSDVSTEVFERYYHNQIPCPFLSREGSCAVYEARPLIARTHIVFSSPGLCKTPYKQVFTKYEGDYFPKMYKAIELLSRLVFDDLKYKKHLPVWFVTECRF